MSILKSEHFTLLEGVCGCFFFVQRDIRVYGSEDTVLTHRSEWIHTCMAALDIDHVCWEYTRKEKEDFSLLNPC